MKIKSLQISNVLSFQYYADVTQAPKIEFEEGLNILIGQNGSGKSTALEVINFLFKKVLLLNYHIDQDRYQNRNNVTLPERKETLRPNSNQSIAGFRLEPNWNTETREQKIRLEITLDEIDKANLDLLKANKDKLNTVRQNFTADADLDFEYTNEVFEVVIQLQRDTKQFTVTSAQDPGYFYLTKYNFYKKLITLYNYENPDSPIPSLYESFTLIGGYRNYNAFNESVSLAGSEANKQIQEILHGEYSKSTNATEDREPPIFNLVRLRLAEKHYDLFGTNLNKQEVEQRANDQEFLKSINDKLDLVNLRVELTLVDQRKWQYNFAFIDKIRNKKLPDINTLSAGQKAIIHLVFEAYGRGELKGGVVIIDEPEIHLHYQFQNEYLRVIEDINNEHKCQYILVTHSESLINSSTISRVKRFALNTENYTHIKSPIIKQDQKTLIQILDNTRSTYAFFAKKVILVEGDTDRYFFKAVLRELKLNLNSEIAVLDIRGKGNFEKWRDFFEGFGLEVYYIGDFDNIFTLNFGETPLIEATLKDTIEGQLKQQKLDNLNEEQKRSFKELHDRLIEDVNYLSAPKRVLWKPLLDKFVKFVEIETDDLVASVKANVPDLNVQIENKYTDKIYLLKNGALEDYYKPEKKGMAGTIHFCESELSGWLQKTLPEVLEIKAIINSIVN